MYPLKLEKEKKVALLVHPKCNWKVFEVEPSHQRQFLYSVKGKVVMTKCILKSHVLLLQKGKLLFSSSFEDDEGGGFFGVHFGGEETEDSCLMAWSKLI